MKAIFNPAILSSVKCKRSISIFLIFLLFFLPVRQGFAQTFHLVKDINASTDANPSNFNNAIATGKNNIYAVMNGISYFAADDGAHGFGLWRTDGTPTGTYQVKEGIAPKNIVVSNGRLLFVGTGTTGLWKSDGTEAGTIPILPAVPEGLNSFIPFGITDLNGVVFFSLIGITTQLWKTDGTAGGTVLVKDLQSQNFFNLGNFAAIKNKLYFSAVSSTDFLTSRLWISNGSPEGTFLISNNIAAPQQMIARSSDLLDSLVYFTGATSQYANRFLYATSGAAGTATMAEGFSPRTTIDYYPRELTNIDGIIYFMGGNNNNESYGSLYKYNTNNPSIQLVKDAGDKPFQYLCEQDGTLYFTATNSILNTSQLWKSDGTSAGNVLLRDSLYCSDFTKAGNRVYFSANNFINGYELWTSNGTSGGTKMVADISSGKNSSGPGGLTYFNGQLLFSARDDSHGKELWISNGTSAGTFNLKDINKITTASSGINYLTTSGNIVFFPNGDNNNNSALWKSDGASAGTFATNDTIYVGEPRDLTPFKNRLFFSGGTVSGLQGLFGADGTLGNTVPVKVFGSNAAVEFVIATDNLLYFSLYNYSDFSRQLWRSDGTTANTFKIKDGLTVAQRDKYVAVGSELFFFPNNGELWKTNGTIAGTNVIKTFDSNPSILAAAGNNLFMSLFDGTDYVLWKSDGSAAGTTKVTDKIKSITNLIPSKQAMYCIANGNTGIFGDIGPELYKTDGTDNGTVLVKDIQPGISGTTLFSSITIDSTLYFFTAGTAGDTTAFWKTDGTSEGTVLISAIGNSGLQVPIKAVACNGKIFFIINNLLWESSGLKAGTRQVTDNIFPDVSVSNYSPNIAAAGNQLFFTANNYRYGEELYAGNITAAITTYTTIMDGNWDDPNTWTGKVVPPAGFNIIIKNKIIGNLNTSCNSLRVQSPGSLTINAGVKINIRY